MGGKGSGAESPQIYTYSKGYLRNILKMPLFAGRVFFHQFLTIQGTNLGETVFYRNNNWMISMTVAFQQLFLHVCAHSSLQLNGGQMSFPMFAALQQCVKIFHQEKVVQHVLRNVTVHHRKHPI